MYIAQDSIDSALRFLVRAEETINGLSAFSESGAPFQSTVPELQGMRPKLIIDFPHHIVFYIERDSVIEVVRVLGGGQDMGVEVEKV
jgi:plasmid stabilization system protein ParE